MKKTLLRFFVAGFLCVSCPLWAGEASIAPADNPAYRQRADKIVATLGLSATEAEKSARVRDAIVGHYRGVNGVDDAVDARIKELKAASATDKTATVDAIKVVRDEAQPKLDRLHAEFLTKLSADLTPVQIEQVKDGLTYGVLPLTYGAYQRMLPDLSSEQKAQILAWLTEAREHAMDAGSSEAKHAWFGKYKGKITNYLSKAGYDLKAAEKNLTKTP